MPPFLAPLRQKPIHMGRIPLHPKQMRSLGLNVELKSILDDDDDGEMLEAAE